MTIFKFYTPMTVASQDVNQRNHVGYQHYFTYFQQARIAYLAQFGCTETDIFGYGLIITEANCRYKRELSLGDPIRVYCRVSEIKEKMMRMAYAIMIDQTVCAEGFTINLSYDYAAGKVVALPDGLVKAVGAFEKLTG